LLSAVAVGTDEQAASDLDKLTGSFQNLATTSKSDVDKTTSSETSSTSRQSRNQQLSEALS